MMMKVNGIRIDAYATRISVMTLVLKVLFYIKTMVAPLTSPFQAMVDADDEAVGTRDER